MIFRGKAKTRAGILLSPGMFRLQLLQQMLSHFIVFTNFIMSAHTLLCLQELHQREFNQWKINVIIRDWARQRSGDSWAEIVGQILLFQEKANGFGSAVRGRKPHRDYSGFTWKVLEVQITIHHLYGASHHLRYEVII